MRLRLAVSDRWKYQTYYIYLNCIVNNMLTRLRYGMSEKIHKSYRRRVIHGSLTDRIIINNIVPKINRIVLSRTVLSMGLWRYNRNWIIILTYRYRVEYRFWGIVLDHYRREENQKKKKKSFARRVTRMTNDFQLKWGLYSATAVAAPPKNYESGRALKKRTRADNRNGITRIRIIKNKKAKT